MDETTPGPGFSRTLSLDDLTGLQLPWIRRTPKSSTARSVWRRARCAAGCSVMLERVPQHCA